MKLLLLPVIIALIAACSGGSSTSFTQVGYFKDSNKFRVFTYHVSDTNWFEIYKHASELMHTQGAPTAAYYYTDRNLVKNISSLNSFGDAIDHAYNPGCVFSYWKKPNGEVVSYLFPQHNF